MPAVPPADAARIHSLLAGGPGPAFDVACVASTASTNADLAELAKAGAKEGQVIVSEHQSAGRGRFSRAWVDTPGANVSMSVLLRPTRELQHWGWLPLVAGLALTDAIRAAGVDAVLKWPNDVLVEVGPHPGKLCGILAVMEPTPLGPACVLGMGINVGMALDERPVETATSIGLCGGSTDKSALVARALDSLGEWYARWGARLDLREAYEERCATVGRHVRVQLDAEEHLGEVAEGIAVGVDDEGSLRVMVGTRVVSIAAGDAFHVRPAG